MSKITRRTFVKRTVAASAVFSTFTISGTKASGRVIGANDTVRVCVAGTHGQGSAHIGDYLKLDKVAIVCLADPDSRLFDEKSKLVMSKGAKAPRCVQDPREALDDKDIDVISIATPNHWHSLLTIWACQAGKDVYVEKPLSHEFNEGRSAVAAARKYDRIVQHGTQRRSQQSWANTIAAIQSGKYGKLLVSKGYACKPRWSIGNKPIVKPPAELDFDVWKGPADVPYHENLVHYNWHWFWPTGNGEIGNQGVHQMDIARWAIKDATLPKSVWSLGGRLGYEDQAETPNMQMAVFDYGDVKLVFEVRGLVGGSTSLPSKSTNEFFTSEGRIFDGKFYPKGGGKAEKLRGPTAHVTPGGRMGSFLHVVRSRNRDECNADVLEGHYSAGLCHLANISYRLGEQVPFNKKTKMLGDDKVVYETFANISENLTTAGVKLEETDYQLGPLLEFDASAERFVDNSSANALLTREYRQPYVVPPADQV